MSPPAGSRDDDDILTETPRGPSPIPLLLWVSFFFWWGTGDFCCSQLREGAPEEGRGGEAMTPAGLLDEDR